MRIPNARQDVFGNKVVTISAPKNMIAFIEDNCMDDIVKSINEKLADGTLMREFQMPIVSKEIPVGSVAVLKGAFSLTGIGGVRAVLDIQVRAEVERFREMLPENLLLKCAMDFQFQDGIRYQVISCGRTCKPEREPVVFLTPFLMPNGLKDDDVIERIAKHIIAKASPEYLQLGFSKDPAVIETGLGLTRHFASYEEAGHMRENVEIHYATKEIWIDNQRKTYDRNYLSRFAGCARYVLLMPFFALNGLVTDDFERIGKKEVPFDEYDSNVESQLAEVKSKMFRLAFSIWMPKPFMVSKIETALKDPCPRFVRPHGYKMHPAARLMHLAEKMKGENNIAICRTKTRMLHLGYSEANGINIHIDDMLLEPFMVNPAKQNRKLGYVMPVSTCAELYETSDYFQQLAATGCYVYAGGFMTRNTEGGVLWKSEGAVLGAGANNDVSLYCLAQDKEYDEEKDAYAYSFGKQRYDEALEAHFDVPGEVFSDEEMERRKRDEDRVMAVPSIHGMLGMLWDEAKPRSHSISMLTLKILLSEDLARYDLDTMVAFCVDCHLMPWVSYCVLRRLGLEVEPGGHHAMILDCFYGMNMKTLNALLKESGRSALAIL